MLAHIIRRRLPIVPTLLGPVRSGERADAPVDRRIAFEAPER